VKHWTQLIYKLACKMTGALGDSQIFD
jgi:hypothetical protein